MADRAANCGATTCSPIFALQEPFSRVLPSQQSSPTKLFYALNLIQSFATPPVERVTCS